MNPRPPLYDGVMSFPGTLFCSAMIQICREQLYRTKLITDWKAGKRLLRPSNLPSGRFHYLFDRSTGVQHICIRQRRVH